MSNDKVYVVVGPNFRVKGVYSSYRLALAKVKNQGEKGYNIEVFVIDGIGTLENSTSVTNLSPKAR